MEIRVGTTTLAVTMRTPGNDLELAAGFLFSEKIVACASEIARIEHCREASEEGAEDNIVSVTLAGEAPFALADARRLTFTTSACGLCGKASIESVHSHFPPLPEDFTLARSVLPPLPEKLLRSQGVFERTGGLHAAGLFDPEGNLLLLREDIGRHNAVDKVIGACLLEERLPLSETILLVSGRASFEIVQKAIAARIPAVAAVSAPSSLAVELAAESKLILIGFLRGEAFNVYSGESRVIENA
jgi:FdhD protein